MNLNRQVLDEAKKERIKKALYTIEAEQLSLFWEVASVATFFVLVLLVFSAAFNWRSVVFFASLGGEYITPEAARWIAVPLALGIAYALMQSSIKKALIQIQQRENLHPSFGQIFLSWVQDRSLSIFFFMMFGVFGALLFLWGETQSNEMEVIHAGSKTADVKRQIEQLDYDYQQDRDRIIGQIEFYTNLNLVQKEVKPREAKLEKMKTAYETKRTQLTGDLDKAQHEAGKFRPTNFLSNIIEGNFWKRVIVITICAFLLSCTTDLAQYTIVNMTVARCYAHLMVTIDIEEIYDSINNMGQNSTDLVEEKSTTRQNDSTVIRQDEAEEIQEIIENGSTNFSETQSKMIKEMIRQMRETGKINKSKLAESVRVDRQTIYNNWDVAYNYIKSMNGKLMEESV